ncbi:MAG: HDOD domain-containing protein [Deltaproteobacteria bacterium]|nr:HDOD domain-containing protein [Deltaproteobacteria bacterium]
MAASGNILEILRQVRDLPSLPQVVHRVMEVMDDARSSVKDVAKALEDDPAMTAKVLRISNSAYYGVRQEITSVSFAISRMGFNEIRNLVVSTGVLGAVKDRGTGSLDYERFWRHCLIVALAAKVVHAKSPSAPAFSKTTENPYFVAGLLHDIGILVLDQFMSTVYREVLDHVTTNMLVLQEAEQAVLGSAHGDVGAFLCGRWNLPDNVRKTVLGHHAPQDVPEIHRTFVQVVHVADALAHEQGYGEIDGQAPMTVDPDVLDDLGLDEAKLNAIRGELKGLVEHSETLRLLMS